MLKDGFMFYMLGRAFGDDRIHVTSPDGFDILDDTAVEELKVHTDGELPNLGKVHDLGKVHERCVIIRRPNCSDWGFVDTANIEVKLSCCWHTCATIGTWRRS